MVESRADLVVLVVRGVCYRPLRRVKRASSKRGLSRAVAPSGHTFGFYSDDTGYVKLRYFRVQKRKTFDILVKNPGKICGRGVFELLLSSFT